MVVPLLRNEIAKALRTKLPYFGIASTALICILSFVATRETGGGEAVNAWGFVAFAMQAAFADVGMIFIAIFCGMLIAGETGSGTARVVLSSPVLRWEFYAAKMLTGLLYMLVVSASALLTCIGLGFFGHGFGDVADSAGVVYASREVVLNCVIAFVLSWLPLSATALFGIFVSTVTKRAGQAIGVVIGTLYLVKAVKHIIGIAPYIFTSYLGSPWAIFHAVAEGVDYQWSPEVWKIVGISLIYCVVAFAAGLAVFSRRDLND